MPFQRDGILLLNKENQYHLGPSPLALLWKDAQCSRYYLDTDAGGTVPQWQHITLQYLESGHVATGDSPPIVLGAAPSQLTHQNLGSMRYGDLRCCLTSFTPLHVPGSIKSLAATVVHCIHDMT